MRWVETKIVRRSGSARRYDETTASTNSRRMKLGIEAGGRLVENQQFRARTDGGNQGQLHRSPFREGRRGVRRIQTETLQQFGFDVPVPAFAKRCKVIQGLPDGHPRIKGGGVGNIGNPPFDGHFIVNRIQSKDRTTPEVGRSKIKETFNGRSFAGAIAAKKTEASAGADGERNAIDGVGPAVGTNKSRTSTAAMARVAQPLGFPPYGICYRNCLCHWVFREDTTIRPHAGF